MNPYIERVKDISLETGEIVHALDLLSTSQKKCPYGAPLVATVIAGKARIGQSCCNHWECPVCGIKRAKQEYRRIVAGCTELAKEHDLYFVTLTCRGRELSLEEAEQNYYAWTNHLLTLCRQHTKKHQLHWAYVQVTERQKRGHPHSHLITTFCPADSIFSKRNKDVYSKWFAGANNAAGLGSQHRISRVENAGAVSRYVAKYLFKDTMREKFPAKWKRVRYSRNFPDVPEVKAEFVQVLNSPKDWKQVARYPARFEVEDMHMFKVAGQHIANLTLVVDRSTN